MEPKVRSTALLGQTAFRYSSYDSPFWSRSNRTSGRWHRAGRGATQYLTLHPDGAWAELARNENLRNDDDFRRVRMPIWLAMFSAQALADYSSFARAESAGFPPDALVNDDYSQCQEEGERLREIGFQGVVAPSAALPGVVNVTIFGPRVLGTWGSEPKLARVIPACVVARGGPLRGLTPRVRYRGQTHSGHEQYVVARAEANELLEPPTMAEDDSPSGSGSA